MSLRFCFDDGTELVNKAPDAGPPPTAIMSGSVESLPPTIPAPPRTQRSNEVTLPMAPTAAGKARRALPWLLGAVALVLVLGVAAVLLLKLKKQPLVMHLVLQVVSSTPDRDAAVSRSVAVITSRLDALGVSRFEVKPGNPGTGQIVVNLPALNDPERVKKIISAWGRLELTHVVGPPSPQVVQTFTSREAAIASFDKAGSIPENRRVLVYSERDVESQLKKWVIVESPSIVDGSELRTAKAAPAVGRPREYEIQFSLNPAGAQKFGAWTASNINEYLGIVLDDEVKSIAFIKSQITDQGVISGRFTKQSAEDLALVLNSGALPERLQFLEERVDAK